MSLFSVIKAAVCTRKTLKYLSHFEGNIVLVWNHIGDICLALSMLSSFEKTKILVVGSIRHQRLLECYADSDTREFRLLSDKKINAMLTCARNPYTRFLFKERKNIVVTDPWYYLPFCIYQKKHFSIIGFYRECIFNYNGPLLLPKVCSKISSSLQNFIKGKKIAILSPYAGSSDPLPDAFWEEVVSRLSKKDYLVLCNLGPGQREIKSTVPFLGTIFELFEIAKCASIIVGLRSGVFDFLIGTPAPMFVVYEEKYENLYSLYPWERTGPLFETRFADNQTDIFSQLDAFIL